jgi:hypothetical protein
LKSAIGSILITDNGKEALTDRGKTVAPMPDATIAMMIVTLERQKVAQLPDIHHFTCK